MPTVSPWLSKLRERRIWKRILVERLSEPVHLNVLSLLVAMFGSIEAKIFFDLVLRQHHAYSLLNSARKARQLGVPRVTVIEFGVANGAGMLNMCEIARRLQPQVAIGFDIVGFDSGTGMPEPVDYRDHPEHYSRGDYLMGDVTNLKNRLPSSATLVLGSLAETVPAFLARLNESSPLAFVSLDVDYFSSSMDALKIFDGEATAYLPAVDVYVDDLTFETHNTWSGELGAIREFNAAHAARKIEPARWLRESRVFKHASWLSHMYTAHVLDHPLRSPGDAARPVRARSLANPYLRPS